VLHEQLQYSKVKELDKIYMRQQIDLKGDPKPRTIGRAIGRALGIDEISIRKEFNYRHNYRRNHRIVVGDCHWDGIASYCDSENNVLPGLVEGVNYKIRVIQCGSYGFDDEDYLKLKIFTSFLPPLSQERPISTHSNPRRPTKHTQPVHTGVNSYIYHGNQL
jgi:hypothetical protein